MSSSIVFVLWNFVCVSKIFVVLAVDEFYAEAISSLQNTISEADFLKTFQTSSKIICVDSCHSYYGCMSVFYNKQSGECRLHGSDPVIMTPVLTSAQGFELYRFTENVIGRSCSSSSECTVVNSECGNDGRCGCMIGYTYEPRDRTCAISCYKYGDTFDRLIDIAIKANNKNEFTSKTAGECAQLCLDADYTCTAFESSDRDNGQCNLMIANPFDVPVGLMSYSGVDLYTRNCAW